MDKFLATQRFTTPLLSDTDSIAQLKSQQQQQYEQVSNNNNGNIGKIQLSLVSLLHLSLWTKNIQSDGKSWFVWQHTNRKCLQIFGEEKCKDGRTELRIVQISGQSVCVSGCFIPVSILILFDFLRRFEKKMMILF